MHDIAIDIIYGHPDGVVSIDLDVVESLSRGVAECDVVSERLKQLS